MAELVRIPLEDGTYLLAEVDRADVPADAVVLASPEPGRATAQAAQSLESGLRSLRPALVSLSQTLQSLAPDSVTLEFGVKLGGETGIILAKGTAEVNFTVSLEWHRAPSGPQAVSPSADQPTDH
jgi:hypothetical protein